ncbi:cupin domain-containing protein [Shewanella sp. NIFS-20-20]|uniref:cupin domain-containing protein n=1 Tax=Shewanella sp. NIFS-20-20 TaxID=2853806 RepID=UPI001C4646B1|nr:cupin domain-containing protein [Shewanella sp. NIFS-20-20]MBV7314495.1 cupin domain-containing protein [Shewanella sp. NIFS-20-20]
MAVLGLTNNGVWQHLRALEDGPEGLLIRGTLPVDANGVELMLEHWDQGTSEPKHYHPGDDMTIVMEGMMVVQCYRQQEGKWVADGSERVYRQGETAYLKAQQVHSVRYSEACKLVYIHDGQFDFIEVNA